CEADVIEALDRALAGAAAWEAWYEVGGPDVLSLGELAALARASHAAGGGAWEPDRAVLAEQRLIEPEIWARWAGLTPASGAADDVRAIGAAPRAALAHRRVDALIATGGTGMAPRDVTPEALAPLCERPFPGFGELFRMISRADIGSAAWLSRAGAGVARGKLVFWLPGSPAGARL